MKKVLVLILSVLMVSMLVVTTVSAGSKKLLDCRELEEYGQQHYYLGAPISVRPDVEDATVSENEYSLSYEFKKGDKTVFIENGTDVCNEWARVYVAYDEQNIYLAMQTKDTDYVKGKDGVSFNLNFKDRGHPYETITRMCFDLYQHKEAEEDDISTFTTRCRFLLKNEKGEWENLPTVEGMEYITDISGKYDEKTQVFTVELEMYLKPVLRFWNNELDLKDLVKTHREELLDQPGVSLVVPSQIAGNICIDLYGGHIDFAYVGNSLRGHDIVNRDLLRRASGEKRRKANGHTVYPDS